MPDSVYPVYPLSPFWMPGYSLPAQAADPFLHMHPAALLSWADNNSSVSSDPE